MLEKYNSYFKSFTCQKELDMVTEENQHTLSHYNPYFPDKRLRALNEQLCMPQKQT